MEKKAIEVITAKDARTISEGDLTMDMIRENIYSSIREAAESGLTSYTYLSPEDLGDFVTELEDFGYTVEILLYKNYKKYIINW